MPPRLTVPLALAGLFVAFAVISLLVVITRRHPALVKSKLKIGALILSLSGTTVGCGYTVSCYEPLPEEHISIDQVDSQTGVIAVNLAESATLSGRIAAREGSEFTYVIRDDAHRQIQSDTIRAYDGEFDERDEEFTISLGTDFPEGLYDLIITSCANRQCTEFSFRLHVAATQQ